jgi:hypothetical protein
VARVTKTSGKNARNVLADGRSVQYRTTAAKVAKKDAKPSA